MRVAVYAIDAGSQFGSKRALHVAKAMRDGLRRQGVAVEVYTGFDRVRADVAVAYGWVHEPVFSTYKLAGAHFVYWDLGYFRRDGHEGHHRIAVDDWDVIHNMAQMCPDDRWLALRVERGAPNAGAGDVILAGMSDKAAGTHGFRPGEWERRTEKHVRELAPEVRVVVRPKPSRRDRGVAPIAEALKSARALVTHHSNAALDALVAGVPCFAAKGAGKLLSPRVLTHQFLTAPEMPDPVAVDRLLADVAYAQWTPAEMRSGAAWEHVRRLI